MENGQACSCFNGTQDDEGNFSAPVPVIGLYIAGATLVCLLLIVADLVKAFPIRNLVPCRFFTLNSFTLTIVGVVTKIPVDLTTPMPGGFDQLAKLYGTGLLFIFMVLFLPSVGNMSASERIPNLASLTLVVITVIVNICMQIGTGLIFKFLVEHVVIMVLMLLTLSILWSSTIDVDGLLDSWIDDDKKFVKDCQSARDDRPGLDQDMKRCLASENALEILRCTYAHYSTMGFLCATLFIVSSEATFRAAVHQKTSVFFGQSVSDYKWSMWVLVGTQIVTIVVGSVSIGLKSLYLARNRPLYVFAKFRHYGFRTYQLARSFMPLFGSYYLPKSLSRFCIPEISQGLQVVVSFLQFIIDIGMEWTDQVLINVVEIFKKRNQNEREEIERIFHQYILKERLRNPQSSPLIQLLSRYPDHQRNSLMLQLDSMHSITGEFILFILLVRVTDVLPPSKRTRSLVSTFDEVFDILYFIGENTNNSYRHGYTMWICRDYWMRRKTGNHYFQRCLSRWRNKLNYDAGCIRKILETEGTISIFHGEDASLVDLVNIQENEPLDALYISMEELFLCLLHRFLNRLPNIIFKYIVESSNQDYSKRVKMCLKFLCRLNLIDAEVQWSETNIISLITWEATGGGHRIAAGIVALINASLLNIGVLGEELQGNHTIISSDDNSGIIAGIADRIAGLTISSPPIAGVANEEQGSQIFIRRETLNDDRYDRKIVVRVAACLAALILDSRLAIVVTGEEQGSRTLVTSKTVTDDYMREIVSRIATGIVTVIFASPSQAIITSETLTDDYRRIGVAARIAGRVAARIIQHQTAYFPFTTELPSDEGQNGISQIFGVSPEKLLQILFIKLLSNICSTSSSNRVSGEEQGSPTSIASDGADHV